ncbi:uncharacterized protein A1O9_02766 [Exophiala aquamarina CBS 119918]|uniref:Uncharacterized protein n=1 Tax=Exophiala aquamarina CBS 119918 TaxID=1182545 RepID=A0A072PMV6_9EURO|nr:uncharacterized protein A1O9_02766 [Exophiala aquamarina CBS 119918]KEF61201.1 hypothetical protein A1O9_02766 [Exophiala aquamarina CBS 119918]
MGSIPHATLSYSINSSVTHKHLSASPSLSKNNGTDTPNSEISTISTGSLLASTNSSQDSLARETTSTKPAPQQQQQQQQQQQLNFSALREIFSTRTNGQTSDPAQQPQSPLWYILTTAVLLSYHKEKLIGELWTYVTSGLRDDDDEERMSVARRIREACLKSSTLVGFPRAINALFSLKSAIDSSNHSQLSSILATDRSLRSPLSSTEKYERGLSFFQDIYRQHTARVISAMDATSGGDLTHFAINCIYGELLSEHSVIGGLETGLLEFVCCLADGCSPQAKG